MTPTQKLIVKLNKHLAQHNMEVIWLDYPVGSHKHIDTYRWDGMVRNGDSIVSISIAS